MKVHLVGQVIVHQVDGLKPDPTFADVLLKRPDGEGAVALCGTARGVHWLEPEPGHELCRRGCFREEKDGR